VTTPVTEADQESVDRLVATRPQWTGLIRACEVTGNERVLFHAGPPYHSWHAVPEPVRNSLALACVYEGWAQDPGTALELLETGLVSMGSAQDSGMVVPLAGVISPSMMLHRITDAASDRVKYAALNEGTMHCLRLGMLDEEIPPFQRWLNGPYADWLASRVTEPVALLPLIDESLGEGDDGHSRTLAGSSLFAELLVDTGTPVDMAKFQRGCAAFALNLWMGAAALILGAAESVGGSEVVTRAGGNGAEFGIQVASQPGRWHTVTATSPRGPVDPAHAGHGAIGAIGDSAVVDMLGLGGQSLRNAPTVVSSLSGHLPGDAIARTQMLLPRVHPDAGRLRTGLSARTVAAQGTAPLVLLGLISSSGRGRIGGGVYEPPLSLFVEATASSSA
jgi:hypothetical protein